MTRKKLLAVVYFVQYFRHYLLGRDLVIRTDHNALRWVMSFKDHRDQMARSLEVLCQYRFKIIHRDDKKNIYQNAPVKKGSLYCLIYHVEDVMSARRSMNSGHHFRK